MRVDVLSIFPGYFDVLQLSLMGKAQLRGLLDLRVHDLRDYASDKHRTVDDSPTGGGAGMVMKAEPWGQALDTLLSVDSENAQAAPDPLVIITSPAGEPFKQALAAELAQEEHLIFACGRYEGIDQRVHDEYAQRGRVKLISLGDYVLNGGEVAALAMIEACARLIPGVLGNPASLVEESHQEGLLEYPVYTKPAVWRGRAVPEVLLSGNHAAIAAWRSAQSVKRTRQLRPELLGD